MERMEQEIQSSSLESAASSVMAAASLPLTLAFVSTLVSMPETTSIPSELLTTVENIISSFSPPPKKCAIIFGPFFERDVLLGSQHSELTPAEEKKNASEESTRSHSIIAWFIPRPKLENYITFSLMDEFKFRRTSEGNEILFFILDTHLKLVDSCLISMPVCTNSRHLF
jgi:hypothetical protein